ncbi:hypothetical protein MTP99_018976 [Tenebrio molitor]|uniref:uncharacterized protein isoform X2 n=1 Tax=Tenebrio molitor TaxID=7067 RepID=UPI001C3B9D5B|nr:hypothetical protein MTP99_018976 [Tenebrio molitor]CAH1377575.1 unnamed protein product [Tenebrio molitor]
MNVKQERHDEAEIQALADKILEASKNRMVVNQQKTHAGVGQNLILNSMMNDKKKQNNSLQATNCGETGKAIDEESVRGRFGWETIGKNPIPYINRLGEKYCAVRMVEMKALNKYLNYLHQDIYNCTCIRSYYITEPEGRLLNEINIKHCDYQFGKEQFTQRDLIVRLSDAIEFYNFLCSCYTKLVNGETDSLGRSGFIRINKESVVPYTVYNDQKYVPLFYFEGETENLKQRANKLEGWDLSYLKFCCKVQGIRNELFAHDSCSVISLNDIKNYFPPGTLFEDYWPKKSVDSQLLISGNTRNQSQIIQWTRQPTGPPIAHPVPSPRAVSLSQPKPPSANSQMHNVHSYPSYGMAGQHPYHPPQSRTPGSAIRTTYPAAAGNRHMRSPNYYSNITQGPPPLVPTTQAQSNLHYTNAQTNATPNYMISGEQPSLNQINYHQEEPEEPQPPPMIPIRQFLANGGVLSPNFLRHQQAQRMHMDVVNQNSAPRDLQNNYNVSNRQSILINTPQPAHQQSSRTQPSTFAEEQHSMSNGQMCLDDVNCKLISIPEPPTSSNHIPYKMQKALVEGKLLPCINMKPYVYAELLVTLPDLIMNFFNNIPVQSCQRVMKVLGIDLYKPNNSQTHVLMESGKCQNMNDVVPLVQVTNVIDFMPQLKYMLGGVLPNMSNKRQRNS